MRIISGKYKGKQLQAPANLPVRPTTDYAKTALFNMVNSHFDIPATDVLDLFAGTGSISYEFVSRGAHSILAVDENIHCVKFMSSTIEKLQANNMRVYKADVFKFILAHGMQYDIVFADPPYGLPKTEELPGLIINQGLLKPNGWFILEHEAGVDYSTMAHFIEYRHYGKVGFSIFGQS